MKRPLGLLMLFLCLAAGLDAKPPKAQPTPEREPTPQPAPATPPADLLRWFLEQDGGPRAIAIPVMEALQAVSNQAVTPLKPSDAVDAAVVAKISTALDHLLPKLNRPDGPVRLAAQPASVPSLVDEELQSSFASLPGTECVFAATGDDVAAAGAEARTYPQLRLTDVASHRTYYLATTFVPAGKVDEPLPLLRIDPATSGKRLAGGGVPLLIVLEQNGKSGKELAFLNWQLVDLQAAKVRLRLTFSATGKDLSLPGAAINDGRKGRD